MKKAVSVILAAVFVLSLSVSVFSANVITGDVTGDGFVTADDARRVLRCAAKLEELSEKELKKADVNGDGAVNSADARRILRVSAKLEVFPDEEESSSVEANTEEKSTEEKTSENTSDKSTEITSGKYGVGQVLSIDELPGEAKAFANGKFKTNVSIISYDEGYPDSMECVVISDDDTLKMSMDGVGFKLSVLSIGSRDDNGKVTSSTYLINEDKNTYIPISDKVLNSIGLTDFNFDIINSDDTDTFIYGGIDENGNSVIREEGTENITYLYLKEDKLLKSETLDSEGNMVMIIDFISFSEEINPEELTLTGKQKASSIFGFINSLTEDNYGESNEGGIDLSGWQLPFIPFFPFRIF